MTEDVLHAILELELPLLQGNFFDLFRFGKVGLGGELVESIFELVVLVGEVVKLRVGLDEDFPQTMRLRFHLRPPCLGAVV
jgi:hypothetical protein